MIFCPQLCCFGQLFSAIHINLECVDTPHMQMAKKVYVCLQVRVQEYQEQAFWLKDPVGTDISNSWENAL